MMLALTGSLAVGLDNGLALTPPMGYNAYDHIGCCASETSLQQWPSAALDAARPAAIAVTRMRCAHATSALRAIAAARRAWSKSAAAARAAASRAR